MREDALHRLGAAAHFGHDGLVVARIEPAHIAHLPAGVGVEAGGVEHDLALFAGLQASDADAILHQREDARAIDAQRGVADELGLRQLAIHRRRGLLRAALPRGAGAGLLFFLRALEAFHVEVETCIASRIDHEVERHSKSLVKMKGVSSRERSQIDIR